MQAIPIVINTLQDSPLHMLLRDMHTYLQRMSFQLDKRSPNHIQMELVSDTSKIWSVCSTQTNFMPCKYL